MVDSASPKPLVHSVQNIYLYTQQDRHTYRVIYKETNRTAHMIHEHVLSHFTKSKQPYQFITDSWAMKLNHWPITKIGRRTRVKVALLKHAAKILTITLSERKQTIAFTQCPFPELKLSDESRYFYTVFQWPWTLKGLTVAGKHKAVWLKWAPQPKWYNLTSSLAPFSEWIAIILMQKKLVRTVCCTISACNIEL